MMAPERYEEGLASTVGQSTTPPATFERADGDNQGRAALKWPYSSRRQQALAQQRTEPAPEDQFPSSEDEAVDGDRWQVETARGHDQPDMIDGAQSSFSSPELALDAKAADEKLELPNVKVGS